MVNASGVGARVVLAMALVLWCGVWLWVAFQEYAAFRRCVFVSGPWLPCEPRNWGGPLVAALLPLAAAVIAGLLRWGARLTGRRRLDPSGSG